MSEIRAKAFYETMRCNVAGYSAVNPLLIAGSR